MSIEGEALTLVAPAPLILASRDRVTERVIATAVKSVISAAHAWSTGKCHCLAFGAPMPVRLSGRTSVVDGNTIVSAGRLLVDSTAWAWTDLGPS